MTCRDWFQLTLKEGLTVFRDQEFSADMISPAVQRIKDVTRLRTAQFAEDAGPLAHPIRPESYVEMNNFYTATVYEKGAEVVRLYQTLFGKRRLSERASATTSHDARRLVPPPATTSVTPWPRLTAPTSRAARALVLTGRHAHSCVRAASGTSRSCQACTRSRSRNRSARSGPTPRPVAAADSHSGRTARPETGSEVPW